MVDLLTDFNNTGIGSLGLGEIWAKVWWINGMEWVWLSKKVWWVFNDTKDPFGLISKKAQGLILYNLNFEG